MAALSCYRAYGLNIASEFEIPGGIRLEPPVSNPDIVIIAGDTSIGAVDAVNGPYTRNGNALLFDAAGVARYYAPSSAQLFIKPYRDADPKDVSALLIATALPMLMWMRGGLLLHAAGIVPVGMEQAIAIAGPSGGGKSTLAAGLIDAGGRLVGDDSLWLTVHDDTPIVTGLSGTLFRSDSPNIPRIETIIPPELRLESATLAAIIILRIADENATPSVNRLHKVDAIEALLKNRHRPKIPAILGLEAALLPQTMLHCRTLPIYEFTMQKGDVAGSQHHISSMILDNFGSV
jgi:hypothetical protein